MGKLVIVPTPIGNLEDITLRAIRILKEADFILAEDTRTSKKLLMHLEITNQLIAHHIHNEHKTLEQTVAKIKDAQMVALVSDAGTPAISDPGFLLTRACREAGIEVECLPGPTALIPALVGSGFPCASFVFEGFLPHKKGRQTRLKIIAEETRTVVLYESPHRLVKCLKQIEEFVGNHRRVCVVRELTKIYEEYQIGFPSEVAEYYEKNTPKGEIVLLIEAK